jgi:polyisoprenoid-binding protein YceI
MAGVLPHGAAADSRELPMARRPFRTPLTLTLALGALLAAAGTANAQQPPLVVDQAQVSLVGTSNVHDWSAATTTVRLTRAELAPGVSAWDGVLAAGGLKALEIVIPAASLASEKKDLDKNMHKALKVDKHPSITFTVARIEAPAGAKTMRASGTLTIGGVAREIAFDLSAVPNGTALNVSGAVPLLMTDYGITPPKAMLGLLKTDPKVTVKFAVTLGLALE